MDKFKRFLKKDIKGCGLSCMIIGSMFLLIFDVINIYVFIVAISFSLFSLFMMFFSYCNDIKRGFLVKVENKTILCSYVDKIKVNTNEFNKKSNGDWFYNTKFGYISNVGYVSPVDFKIVACDDNSLGLPKVDAYADTNIMKVEYYCKNVDTVEIYH